MSLPIDTAVSRNTGVNLHPIYLCILPLLYSFQVIKKKMLLIGCSLEGDGALEKYAEKISIKWITGSILVWQTQMSARLAQLLIGPS